MINLDHCMRDTSGRLLLQHVLDAIQYQSEIDFSDALQVATTMPMWISNNDVNTLLSARVNRLTMEANRLAKQVDQFRDEQNHVLYAYSKSNPEMRLAVGTTTQDHSRLKLTYPQFKDWIRDQLSRTDLPVKTRESLAGADYWASLKWKQAKTIIIENRI